LRSVAGTSDIRPVRYATRAQPYALDAFRASAEAAGRGYQTAMNDALRAAVIEDGTTLEARIRKIVHEEIRSARTER
jgi:hypothetical protein